MIRLGPEPQRIVVAMSGGVDSSVVAGLLVEAGHDVVGITMRLYDPPGVDAGEGGGKTCCGLDDVQDARAVADLLGIPYFVSRYVDVFRREVVDVFVEEYLRGRTPNPCVRCNDAVKFRPLAEQARRLGARWLATGHYARIVAAHDGGPGLARARDVSKDQSYFLAGIERAALHHTLFPLGELTKDEVRDHARRMGLPTATKRESQDVCFIPDGRTAAFVEGAAGSRVPAPGPIVDVRGLRIGHHRGLHHYTVGQRRGLGVEGPERTYVVALRPEKRTLVAGGREELVAWGLSASSPRWHDAVPRPGRPVVARIRHRLEGSPARLVGIEDDLLELAWEGQGHAVAPGQQVVLYEGDRVLGAATIEAALSPPDATGHHGAMQSRTHG